MDRHNNFDLLRLIAALSVIFSHAFLLSENSQAHDPLMILTGGQSVLGLAGVFVFFTISGYLVTQSFANTPSPWVFLAKRALRIFPGLIACLLVCAFVVGPLVTTLPLAEYLTRREPYLFVLHNSVLDVVYNGLPGVLFGPGGAGAVVNGPLWSLPCEVMMYLMLFALGVCRLLTLPVALVLLAVGIVSLWFDLGSLLGGAFWLLSFFAAGICLYRLRGSQVISGRGALVALAGLALSIPLRSFFIGFALFGSYLVIYLALNRRLPKVPAARFGDLSYGLYIYGWPIEQSVVYFSNATAPWWAVFGISVAVAVPVAFLSWHLVERRCRWRARSGAAARLAPASAAAND
ncbi:MAG TPA: acyltransferase [Stellaceae bacterium]|nr:acyltransferase [Stellaceae bacterium]